MRDLDMATCEIFREENDEHELREISRLEREKPEIETVLTAFDDCAKDEDEREQARRSRYTDPQRPAFGAKIRTREYSQ